MRKLVRHLTGEEYVSFRREEPVRGQRSGEIDIIVTTTSGGRVCFEAYFTVLGVSDVLQKIKRRMRRMRDCVWVALIPQQELRAYGPQLKNEGIYTGVWATGAGGTTFFIVDAHRPESRH
jgi:hypothetical protein